MTTLAIPSRHLTGDINVVPLTVVQRALWQLAIPILDPGAVAEHKKRAKRGMLWRAIRWQLLAMAALVGLMCLGGEWKRATAVGAAAVVLATLFGWLVNVSDLRWVTAGFDMYQSLNAVPAHVSAAANALLCFGVPQEAIGVEYLKEDPVLFVEEAGRRYDLILW